MKKYKMSKKIQSFSALDDWQGLGKEKAEEKSFKYKKYLMWAGILVLYPLYLAILGESGFANVISWFSKLSP